MMIFYFILFILSVIFWILLWSGKRRELQGGQAFIHIGSDRSDARLHEHFEVTKLYIRSIDKKYISDKFHLFAETVERLGIKVAEKIVSRFGTVRDVVVGKDLPKNKGAVSFYFKHIEVHKKRFLGQSKSVVREEKGINR